MKYCTNLKRHENLNININFFPLSGVYTSDFATKIVALAGNANLKMI
jgi:hypothetical protein